MGKNRKKDENALFKVGKYKRVSNRYEKECQTLISSRYNVLSFGYDVLIIASQITVFGTGYSTRPRGHVWFWWLFVSSGKKSHQKGGKMVIFWNFLDPSSPRLASGLPRPWNTFNLKQPACLGKLIPSGWSNQLAWASCPCPKWIFL